MDPRLRHALTPVVLASAAALTLAACGSGGGSGGGSSAASSSSSSSTTTALLPTAKELLEKARTTALAAESTHLVGTVTDDGKPMDVDVSGRTDGTNQSLKLKVGGGQEATILTIGSRYYLLGNEEFWTEQGGSQVAKLLQDKYVLMPASEAKDFGDLTIESLLTEMFADPDVQKIQTSGTVTRGRVDGDEAYVVTGPGGAQQGEFFVSADGKATLLKVIGPRDDPAQLTFSEWDQVKPVPAPPESKVIEMPK